MTLLDIKKNLETFFITNYTETQIHWSGNDFKTTAHTEWVYFEYLGEAVMDCGLDNTVYSHKGAINVTVIAQTTFRVNEIASIVLELFKGQNIDGSIIRNASILESAYDKELGKSYMVMNIDVSSN